MFEGGAEMLDSYQQLKIKLSVCKDGYPVISLRNDGGEVILVSQPLCWCLILHLLKLFDLTAEIFTNLLDYIDVKTNLFGLSLDHF